MHKLPLLTRGCKTFIPDTFVTICGGEHLLLEKLHVWLYLTTSVTVLCMHCTVAAWRCSVHLQCST